MAIIIQVYPELSPRIIEIKAPTTSVTVQELYNIIRQWEDEPASMSYPPLINAAGKEDLGGGVIVGITATLQNAKVMFEGRTTPLDDGSGRTCDLTNSEGIILYVDDADFITSGIYTGCTVFNATTQEMATITEIIDLHTVRSFPLSGGSSSGWTSGDLYTIYPNVLCNITGGNLVAIDSADATIDSVMQSPNVQVVRSSSSSATLQELSSIQYSSFGGVVTIDITSSYSGIAFPVGTPQQPVNNITDAISISVARGLPRFYILGNITLDSGIDFDEVTFVGESKTKSVITILDAADVTNCEFLDAEIAGVLDGGSVLRNCLIGDINYVNGFIEQCILQTGTITLGGSKEAHFMDCWSGVVGGDLPIIDMGGSGQGLGMRNYNGGIKLINKSGTEKVSIDLNSGQITLDSTITNGEIILRGIGNLIDNSVGATVNSQDLLSSETITGVTWDILYIDTISGTSGTAFPIGTAGSPSNNITDAKIIADIKHITTFNIIGSIILNTSFSGCSFQSVSVKTGEIDLNNQDVTNTSFGELSILGVQNGNVHCHTCTLTNVINMEGEYIDCTISSNLDCKTGAWTYIWGGRSSGSTAFTINMNGAAKVGITKTTLICKVQNMTNANAIFLKHGQGITEGDNTNTAGTIKIGGEAGWVNSGVGGSVDILDDTTRTTTTDKVWAYER